MNYQSQPRRPLIVTGATLITGADTAPIQDAVLIAQEHRITNIGKRQDIAMPPDGNVVDAQGKWIAPGLIDLHVHLDEDISPSAWVLHGVTSVRDVGSRLVTIQQWRARAAKGEPTPRIYWMGRNIDEGKPSWWGAVAVKNAAGVPALLDDMQKQGVDGVKLYTGAGRDVARAVIADAHRRGWPVTGHLNDTPPSIAASYGIDNLEHVSTLMTELRRKPAKPRAGFGGAYQGVGEIDLNSAPVRRFVDTLARHHVAVTPTVAMAFLSVDGEAAAAKQYGAWTTLPTGWRSWWKNDYWSFISTKGWTKQDFDTAYRARDKYLAFVRLLHRSGVAIVAGTDSPAPWVLPGAGLHLELERYVQAGLTPAETLRAATSGAAAILRKSNDVGTLKAGAYADFLLLDADPLQDIRNLRRIAAVYQGGQLVDRTALKREFLAARKIGKA